MSARLLATLELFRPHNMAAAAVCVYSSYYLSGGREFHPVLPAVVFTAFVTGLGNLINDYFDADIDRVNKPRRPIPSGRLSRRYVFRLYSVGTIIVTLLMFVFLPRALLVLMLIWEVLLFLYARKAKRVALVGNILIGSVCASAFLAGAMVIGTYDVVVFPIGFAFVFVMGRELVKGAEDVEGDSAVGASTLAVRFGARRAAHWGAALLFVCAVAAPLPALVQFYGRIYGLLIELVVVPGILAAAYIVLRFPKRVMFNRASWILKIEMFLGIIVIGLGRS
ncbi:MAG: geranylgeranylglycerol-phosphate geranylgeranyltransferase [Candidatus Latescibacterota bacterium]|nr:MAG: geranylgeranylglycerol-phosphate geranylgeranyltransferase [Candidatus Latescibacterota bacterium]